MAKKATRRAARKTQKPVKGVKGGPKPPTIRGAVIQGILLAAIYFFLSRYVFRTSGSVWASTIIPTIVALVLYTPAIYYWQRYLYRRRMRKQGLL